MKKLTLMRFRKVFPKKRKLRHTDLTARPVSELRLANSGINSLVYHTKKDVYNKNMSMKNDD
jgi:hypothetical protein